MLASTRGSMLKLDDGARLRQWKGPFALNPLRYHPQSSQHPHGGTNPLHQRRDDSALDLDGLAAWTRALLRETRTVASAA